VAADHREQLLVAVGEVGLVVGLVVRLHHLVARATRDPVHPEGMNVEVAADEMEVPRAGALPLRGVRIVWVNVRRPDDIRKQHGTERRFVRVTHDAKFAPHGAIVNQPSGSATLHSRRLHPVIAH
jgi:hypothetical protein